jgi:myo-inositol 2-dehydrogenase/D-chiro-inositol 1-dehydrogenase
MKRLRVGIIGAGRIGRVHATSIAQHVPQAEILAISDVVLDGVQAFADSLGIPKVLADYHAILNDPDIDAVLICSPTNTHADIAIEAARAGKHIFCEKPIDLTVAKVRATMEAVKKAGVKMQVGFNRRFDHNFARVREIIAAGGIGDLNVLRITSRDPGPPPISYVKVSGGMFNDMTIHDFDMARFLSGSAVTEVYAKAAVLVDPAIGEAGDVDTAVITLTFASGAIGIIENCRRAAYGYDQRVEAFGSGGAASASNDTPTAVSLADSTGVHADKPLFFFLERYMGSFSEEVRQFVDAVLNDKPTPVTVEDGLPPLLIALAAKRSVEQNRPVKISEIENEYR